MVAAVLARSFATDVSDQSTSIKAFSRRLDASNCPADYNELYFAHTQTSVSQ